MEVPALGSPRDKIFRQYMLHEAGVEAKKHQMLLMLTIGSRSFSDPSSARSWQENCRRLFSQYANMLIGIEVSEEDLQEEQMLEFYEQMVKQSKPVIHRSKDGKLSVTGVDNVFGTAD